MPSITREGLHRATHLFLVAIGLLLRAKLGAQSLGGLSESFVALTDRVSPAVVQAVSDGYSPMGSGTAASLALRRSTGSGAILSADGYIVTNAHVVAGATRVQVQLPPSKAASGGSIVKPRGKLLNARVVGLDVETDLALIKVDASGLPFLLLADSDEVRQGQIVLAFGSPVGLENSVSMGVVSAVGRQLVPDHPLIYIQTDAPINPGSSGGPLVNAEGGVVGINSMILSQSGGSQGLGFAVPSNIVRTVTDQLKKNGAVTRGEIGIDVQTITPALAAGLGLPRDRGVLVSDITPRRPADLADIRVGDIVLSLNGKPMENARQFQVNLYSQAIHSRVELGVQRGREELRKRVLVMEREGDPDRFAAIIDKQIHQIPQLGIMGIAIDEKIGQMLPELRRPHGILVASAAAGANHAAGLFLPGDVIYSVNNQPISTLRELRDLLEKREPGEIVILQVQRNGRLQFVEAAVE